MQVIVKRDANVQDVIGYTLFEYINRSIEPEIPANLVDTSLWSIRIVEDDGSIDDDFPGMYRYFFFLIHATIALDRSRQIEKFGCDHFALCPSVPIIESTSPKVAGLFYY